LKAALVDSGITSKARIGIDDLAAQTALASLHAGPQSNTENTLRRIRLVKSPAELALMRIASGNNVEAALATARAARELGSITAFRNRFMAEAAARGNSLSFMVLDGVVSDAYDAPLGPGSAFMIDCVTQLRGYHGDYARTVFIGEPSPAMKRTTDAMLIGWGEVRSRLKAGLRFSEVSRIGRETIKAQGYDHAIPFGPHSVGLWHTDQPRPVHGEPPIDIALEAGMILSVDCPLMDVGRGGTAHFEDLMLITENGAEPIHATGDNIIVV
jgi:Xaa-Pro aminopeptidase